MIIQASAITHSELERAVISSFPGFPDVRAWSQIIQDQPGIVKGNPGENGESDEPDRHHARKQDRSFSFSLRQAVSSSQAIAPSALP